MSGFELQETLAASTPGSKAPVPPDPSWTPLEAWVWVKLQAGEIANIDHYQDEGGKLPPADPRKPEDWQDGRRRLSARFLEAILLEEPFRRTVHRKGVRIDAAWFDQEIDLEMAEVTRILWLDRCRFEPRQNFAHLKASSDVTFDGSLFVDHVDLQGAWIRGNLFLRNATASNILLRTAKIDGLVDFSGVKVTRALDMNGANVGQGLLMSCGPAGARAEFGQVNLIGAKVSGQVNLNSTTVKGILEIGGAVLDHDLLMSSDKRISQFQAEFEEVSLRGTRIRGQLALVGAKVKGTLDIGRAEIGQDLLMATNPEVSEHRATFKDIDLRGTTVRGQVELIAARIGGRLVMNSTRIEQSLLMSSSVALRGEFNSVNLHGAVIGGSMVLAGAKVVGTLDMRICDIGQTLDMGSASHVSVFRTELESALLQGAKIGGQLSLAGAKVAGTLDLHSVRIRRGLFLNHDPEVSPARPEFRDVLVARAKIDGIFALRGAIVKGLLVAESSAIDGPVFLEQCEIAGGASFLAAAIEGDVLLGGASISHFDLHGARIGGELSLTPPLPKWRQQDGMRSRLNLGNASCDAIQDGGQAVAWPDEVELDGFTCKRFGGLGADAETDVAKRGSKWFIDWLAKDEPFTRQPYHQCASVLRDMGHPEMANDVLYAGRERERVEALRRGDNPRASGLTLLKWTVGYGYGDRLLWRPLGWAALILVLGICVTYADAAAFEDSLLWWRTFFSLDMLLPIVELSREHTVVQAGLDGFAYGWFVVQRLLGWVLALFLIAGLTGLTK